MEKNFLYQSDDKSIQVSYLADVSKKLASKDEYFLWLRDGEAYHRLWFPRGALEKLAQAGDFSQALHVFNGEYARMVRAAGYTLEDVAQAFKEAHAYEVAEKA